MGCRSAPPPASALLQHLRAGPAAATLCSTRAACCCCCARSLPLRLAACDETAPTAKLGDNERTDKLLAAEQAVLVAGGCVVRLVGLYHGQR